MTTRIKITNEGPENARIRFYNDARSFRAEEVVLKPSESWEGNIWNGQLPVVSPDGHESQARGDRFFAVPPTNGG